MQRRNETFKMRIINELPGGGIIRGGPKPVGGGTAVIFGGGFENGFCAILPALNAAVVASIKCCACSSIHF